MSNDKKPSTANANWRPRTQAIRSGINRAFQETSEGLFLTSSFSYDSAEQAQARFAGEDKGFIYSRYSNPTTEAFETRLATLEGASWCRGTASGMAAVTSTMLGLLSAGDHIVSSRALFGSCRYVVGELCPKLGIETSFVDGADLDAWEKAARSETKIFFLESPSNPGLQIVDIEAVAQIAHAHGAILVVDNVFASPVFQKPLALGADIVVYSATKHMDGQGRVLGGAILGNDDALLTDQLQPFLRNTGPAISPFNAWVLLKSLETMDLRVNAAADCALELATRLDGLTSSPLARVFYPFLDSHPGCEIARRQMKKGGTLITMEFDGSADVAQARAFAFLNALKLVDISNNLGDAKSIATHPRTTTHHRIGEEARLEQGVTPGLVRISVGLEDVEDLWEDFTQAFNSI
ncbi:O-succinylhomoserine sulfhydrylase [Aquisalinus flavus]|uniref:O-succinylhomoserine sulfhydrylase n=1 Tax=Aquisalinus flavus TaxID=1526572 RepID=A0A8J2Y832_9PROT|nr:O-succinylhomoserine sulfhydrylase [Aquisalinus flavus]MBD0425860.1 O-succinylhomoserine sulfhydrylase [Aquisalinus flavus]UNE48542.1 O-succinylhomoserine sulfhydrylase [Aquisalinus flavus]GGD12676.1 O-succinylhomoserine sulfhydrylase [Aquisalinus flavus]